MLSIGLCRSIISSNFSRTLGKHSNYILLWWRLVWLHNHWWRRPTLWEIVCLSHWLRVANHCLDWDWAFFGYAWHVKLLSWRGLTIIFGRLMSCDLLAFLQWLATIFWNPGFIHIILFITWECWWSKWSCLFFWPWNWPTKDHAFFHEARHDLALYWVYPSRLLKLNGTIIFLMFIHLALYFFCIIKCPGKYWRRLSS